MSGRELPAGWAWSNLPELAGVAGLFTDGDWVESKDQDPNGAVRLVQLADVGDGEFRDRSSRFLTSERAAALGCTELQTGDMLISRLADPVGRACIFPGDGRTCVTVVDVTIFRPSDANKCAVPYLLSAVNSPHVRASIEAECSGTTRKRVSRSNLGQVPIPIAPLKEQKRIVAKLEAVQARAEAAKAALDAVGGLLEKFRQSVLAAAFRGDLTREWRAHNPNAEPASALLARIRTERRRRWELAHPKKKYVEPDPVDPTGLPELPEGWCWASWREVGFSQNGRAFPSGEYSDEGVHLLRPGNMAFDGSVRWTTSNTKCMPAKWAEKHPEHIVGPGEIVINLTAQSLKDEFLGRACLTGPDDRCLLNQRIARLTPVEVRPEFILWVLKSPLFRRYVDNGLNTGSLIQHIFTSQIADFSFPLPPIDEQTAIVNAIASGLARQRLVAEVLDVMDEQTQNLTQATLAKAFRGELVPQDPTDEPASALLARIAATRATTDAPKRRGRKAKV